MWSISNTVYAVEATETAAAKSIIVVTVYAQPARRACDQSKVLSKHMLTVQAQSLKYVSVRSFVLLLLFCVVYRARGKTQ
jgi:hypothetical protein